MKVEITELNFHQILVLSLGQMPQGRPCEGGGVVGGETY